MPLMKQEMEKFINCRVKIIGKGNRCYEGDLIACDQHMNVVLSDTEEFSGSGCKNHRRYLGLCVFRGSFVVAVDIISKN